VQLISYDGEPVALVVDGDLAVMAPDIAALGSDDPLFRMTAAMCRLAMEVALGLATGPYDDQRGERYARELLIPEETFAALAWLPDPYLRLLLCAVRADRG
jgi:hypothetical protein